MSTEKVIEHGDFRIILTKDKDGEPLVRVTVEDYISIQPDTANSITIINTKKKYKSQ